MFARKISMISSVYRFSSLWPPYPSQAHACIESTRATNPCMHHDDIFVGPPVCVPLADMEPAWLKTSLTAPRMGRRRHDASSGRRSGAARGGRRRDEVAQLPRRTPGNTPWPEGLGRTSHGYGTPVGVGAFDCKDRPAEIDIRLQPGRPREQGCLLVESEPLARPPAASPGGRGTGRSHPGETRLAAGLHALLRYSHRGRCGRSRPGESRPDSLHGEPGGSFDDSASRIRMAAVARDRGR